MLQIPSSIIMLSSGDDLVNAREKYLVQGYLVSELAEGPNRFRVTEQFRAALNSSLLIPSLDREDKNIFVSIL